MDNKFTHILAPALRIAAAVTLIIILGHQIDWGQFSRLISEKGAKMYTWVVPISAAGWIAYVVRWQLLIIPLGLTPTLPELLKDSLVGLFYGLLVPTGLAADAVKAVRLGRRHEAMRKAALSVAVDRVMALLSVLILFGTRFIRNDAPPPWMIWLIWIGLAALAGLMLSRSQQKTTASNRERVDWTTCPRARGPFSGWALQWLACQFDRMRNLLKTYAGAQRFLVLSFLVSTVYQLLVTLAYYVGGRTLAIDVGLVDYGWIIATVMLAQMVPVTLAGLGVREGVLAFLLAQYGVPSTTSVTLSLVLFSVTLLFGLVGGILELFDAYRRFHGS